MPLLTLGQAAKATGRTKSALSRAIKSGRMSASRTDSGGYQVDPSELFRVYPPAVAEPVDAINASTGSSHPSTVDATSDLLRAEIDGLKAVAAVMQRQLDDVQTDRDKWRSMAERLVLAPPASKSWWRRLVG